MKKIGSCLLLLATEQDPLSVQSIPLLAKAGYDYAEVSLARAFDLSEAEFTSYAKLFEDEHLPVEVFNNAIPRGMALIGPNADENRINDYIVRAVKIAKKLGTTMITMSGPNKKTVPADFTWKEGKTQYIDFLKAYSKATMADGIVLAIEPINQEETGFIATLQDALDMVEAAAQENIKIIVDYYHFFKQKDSLDMLLRLCKDGLLAHVHYATKLTRHYPLLEDAPEVYEDLSKLLSAGYSERISLEAFTQNPKHDLPTALELMRKTIGQG